MEAVIKVTLTAMIACVIIIILKQSRPEFALLAQAAALIAVFAVCSQAIFMIIDYLQNIIPSSVTQSGYLTILFKALAIAIIAKIGADMCRDAGGSALAFGVETAAKAVIIVICLPMFKGLAEIVSGLLKG